MTDEQYSGYVGAVTFRVNEIYNAEQRDARIYAIINPWLDLLFNRTEYRLPQISEISRADVEQLDADFQRGNIAKHFSIHFEQGRLRPVTAGAISLCAFMAIIAERFPEIALQIKGRA